MQLQRQFIEIKSRQLIIELPESFVNHRVEVVALTVDEEIPQYGLNRQAQAAFRCGQPG